MPLLMQPLLTPKQVAEQLNTAESNVLRWIRLGMLPATKVGRAWRVEPEDLRKFLDANKNIQREEQS